MNGLLAERKLRVLVFEGDGRKLSIVSALTETSSEMMEGLDSFPMSE